MTRHTGSGSEPEPGKRVSWAELYFDLVFVVAVTRVSAFIEHDHSWGGVLRAVIVFVPVYWLWVGMAIQTNQQDTLRVNLRLRLFAVALAAVFMAASLDDSYGRLGCCSQLAYWAGRIVLALPQLPHVPSAPRDPAQSGHGQHPDHRAVARGRRVRPRRCPRVALGRGRGDRPARRPGCCAGGWPECTSTRVTWPSGSACSC